MTDREEALVFFIRNDITYRIVSDFDSMYEEMLFEFLVVELDFGNEKVLCCLLSLIHI